MANFERIKINELDLTTAGSAQVNENIVFIPGLMGTVPNAPGSSTYQNRKNTVTFEGEDPKDIQYISAYEANDGVPTFYPTHTNGQTDVFFYNTLTRKLYLYGVGNVNVSTTAQQGSVVTTSDNIVLDANAVQPHDGTILNNGIIECEYNEQLRYLTVTGTTIGVTTSATDATEVTLDEDGKLFVKDTTNYFVVTNGTLEISGTASTTWEQKFGRHLTTKVTTGTSYCIEFNGTNFVARAVTWGEVDNYVSINLATENKPVTCYSVQEFYSNFGTLPYQFKANDEMSVKGGTPSGTAEAGVVFNSLSCPVTKKLYKAGEFDKSFIQAVELLNLGLPVTYYAIVDRVQPTENDVTAEFGYVEDNKNIVDIYGKLSDLFSAVISDGAGPLVDQGTVKFKYLTTGGFPYLELIGVNNETNYDTETGSFEKLLLLCATRGDCFALADTCVRADRPVNGTGSLYNTLNGLDAGGIKTGITNGTYGAIVYPYYSYSCQIAKRYDTDLQTYTPMGSMLMPGSFAYLTALAISLKTNDDWLAIAGVTRGQVPYMGYVYSTKEITSAIADSYQGRDDRVNINAITEVQPYGYCIWGNRTTHNNATKGNLTASSFLNIRNMVSDVKKTIWRACQRCLFEQDTTVLWLNFQSMITPLLDRMVTGQGIKNYKIIKLPTTEKAKLVAQVILIPIYAIENIEVTVVLTDDETQIS